ncbi:LysE family translocator [Streptomyces spectabilis]|uniref:LysE family translocator n=1 Tax=Streptomyces spectabilis TaxID=68270 RepID=A0A5P2X3Q8_STRST|nr:LysE family translocator [Streptomyces spectabilis]MBB5107339.1 threonine/homoserine/homoserine lactone efflux protein [Streptomyces spectabilis]MCI3900030.1 LysE family translocator [Streptomyces spectabilis]QEV57660.1 LysE family translocator [Streptomyces spectabilis]GGV36943.1 lysine transporter LysE [Streptomyces spectabilis]
MLTALAGFALFALLVTVVPGPDTLLVLRNCVRGGRLPGIATAFGAAVGSLAWAVAAAVGLAAALQRWDAAFAVVRLAGAAYLVFLGAQALWAHRRGAAAAAKDGDGGAPAPAPTAFLAFRQGLLSCLLNPKVGIFFVAVVPQFLPDSRSALPMTLLFGVVDAAIAAGWLVLVSVFAARLLNWLRRPRVNTAMERTTGGVLVALGLGTAAETL